MVYASLGEKYWGKWRETPRWRERERAMYRVRHRKLPLDAPKGISVMSFYFPFML